MGTIKRESAIRTFSLIMVLTILISTLPFAASAATGQTDVPGKIYEFDKDSHYEFADCKTYFDASESSTYGSFFISGNIASVDSKEGIPAYEVADGNLSFFYNYTDTILNADLDSWHLVEDKSKKVNDLTLTSNIMKGAIILQTSKDRMNWINVGTTTNAFADTPVRTDAIYNTTDVQLINGCFYRVIVVYELRIRTEQSNFLLINTDKYENKKCAEVYEFYAYTNSGESTVTDPNQTYSLGSRVRVKNFDGYSGEEAIDKDDPHYGWNLGNFFLSGYTDEIAESNGNVVFLKNVGDKVTLWFNLGQNINALNGKNNLSITADTEGYDQYFETPRMNFGRGALIIRYTDHNNVQGEPTIYTNYLEANATVGADTKVQLFEEGDYEVALDYQITDDQLIDQISHYRIFFKFSVRNGNCMVYPFDVATGSELTNSSMTENGFRLDLAKSRYLKVNIKREVLKDSADGLVEDTRFNGPAKDGAQYADEGIYTITVTNEYTGQFTVKKIYVGTNNVLRAHMATGLSIPEINNLVAQGATISDDGTIQFASITPATDATEPTDATQAPTDKPVDGETQAPGDDITSEPKIPSAGLLAVVAVIAILCAAAVVILARKKRQTNQPAEVALEESEGGAEK